MTATQDATIAELQRANAELRREREAGLAREATLAEELAARDAALAQRNTEFSERIEHQAATIDVLKVMSASPGDAQPVFDLIVRQATRAVQRARLRHLYEFDGDTGPPRAQLSAATTMRAHRRQYIATVPDAPDAESSCAAGRFWTGEVIHIRDVDAEPEQFAGLCAIWASKSQMSRPVAARRRGDRSHRSWRRERWRLLRQSDGTAADLRRAGGDRDHQRGDVSRVADPHERSSGNAGIPDRDQRRAEGHQPLDVRSATRAGYGGRDRRPALRCRSWQRSCAAMAICGDWRRILGFHRNSRHTKERVGLST